MPDLILIEGPIESKLGAMDGLEIKFGVTIAGEMMEYRLKATYIDMMKIGLIAGTGGLLSHAPRRAQSLLALTDAFQPEGVTKIYQDSVFMMPHLGVLSTAFPEIAWNIFDKDCLVRLGTVIAPVGLAEQGEKILNVNMDMPDGTKFERDLEFGEIIRVPLEERETAEVVLTPNGDFDVGAGPEKTLQTAVEGGVVGVVIDTRGRPLTVPTDFDTRKEALIKWFKSLDLYPKEFMMGWEK